MLIEMLPKDVTEHWEEVKMAIDATLPINTPHRIEAMSNILTALLSKKMVCWAFSEPGSGRISALVLTMIRNDSFSGMSELVISSVYTFKLASEESWMKGFSVLQTYARAGKCWRIVAYTNVPKIMEVSKRLGGSSEYTFISFPLGEQEE